MKWLFAHILAVVWRSSNAVDYALNILAQKNPALYAARQMAVEALER